MKTKGQDIKKGIDGLNQLFDNIEKNRRVTLIPALKVPNTKDENITEAYQLINNGLNLISECSKQFDSQALIEISELSKEMRALYKDSSADTAKRSALVVEYNQKVNLLNQKVVLLKKAADPNFKASIRKEYQDEKAFEQDFKNIIRPYCRFGYLTSAQLAVLGDILVGVRKAIDKTILRIENKLTSSYSNQLTELKELLNEMIADVGSLMKLRLEATLTTTSTKENLETSVDLSRSLTDWQYMNNSLLQSYMVIQNGNQQLTAKKENTIKEILPSIQFPEDASINQPLPSLYMLHNQQPGTIIDYFKSFVYHNLDPAWAYNIGFRPENTKAVEDYLLITSERANDLLKYLTPQEGNPYIGLAKDIVRPIANMATNVYKEAIEWTNLLRGNPIANFVNDTVINIQDNENVIAITNDIADKKDALANKYHEISQKITRLVNVYVKHSDDKPEDYQTKQQDIKNFVEKIDSNWVFVPKEGSIAQALDAIFHDIEKISNDIDEKIKQYEAIKTNNEAILTQYNKTMQSHMLSLKFEVEKAKKAQGFMAYRSEGGLNFIKNLFGSRKIAARQQMVNRITEKWTTLYEIYSQRAQVDPYKVITLASLNESIKKIFEQEMKAIDSEHNRFKSSFKTMLKEITEDPEAPWNKVPQQLLATEPKSKVHFAAGTKG